MPFRRTADGRSARHKGYAVEIERQHSRLLSRPREGERGFAAGQPAADDGNLHGGSFRMGLVGLGRRGGAFAGPDGPYFFSTGLLKPQPSLAQYRVPRFLNSVAPQLGQVSGTGSSQVINLQVGKLPQP